MDDYTGFETSVDTDYFAVSEWGAFYEPKRPRMTRRNQSATNALPEVLITAEVGEKEEHRRTLSGIFAKLASTGDISRSSMYAAESFIEALPRNKQLPQVFPDGEGGLTMAWSVAGAGRTLITVGEWVLYAVARAGTPQALYLNDSAFDGVIPDELLAIIPA